MVDPADSAILRELARRYAEHAHSPLMAERRKLWKAHNALAPGRPMVLCYPEGAWGELLPESALRCTGALARRWERQLRMRLYHLEVIRDDQLFEPYLDIGWHINFGSYGVEVPMFHGDNRGSYVWDPPIKRLPDDLRLLTPRRPTVDREATMREVEEATRVLGDVLAVRIHGSLWWTMGLTQTLVYLMGLEQLMLAMCDQPESVHALMAFLRDDQLNVIRWAEAEGLLTARNVGDYTGSGGVACTDELPVKPEGPVRLIEQWGFAESQETVGVSPAMFAEFVLPYQLPLLAHFGLNCYGCCEQLEHRIDHVLTQVPRLRRVSVAPLANQRVLAEKLQGRAIFSRKPDPVKVCVGFDEERIRREIRQTLALSRGNTVELILKDTHTVQGEPERLARWVAIARQEVGRVG